MSLITLSDNTDMIAPSLPVGPIIGDPNMVNPAPTSALSSINAALAGGLAATTADAQLAKAPKNAGYSNIVFLLLIGGLIFHYRHKL